MDGTQLTTALEMMAHEHAADVGDLARALVEALYTEVLRSTGADDAHVSLDLETGDLEVTITEGDEVKVLDFADMGRRGAAVLKNAFDAVVLDLRRERLAALLERRAGQVVSGRVRHVNDQVIVVQLDDGVEAELPVSHAPGLRPRTGAAVSALLTGRIESAGGVVRAQLSRKPDEFILRLLEEAVPSIADGSIEIVKFAREPGVRTKLVVRRTDPNGPDPVALIIGSGGQTIRQVTDAAYPERIDVMEEADLVELTTRALAPGKVRHVEVNDSEIVVYVTDEERPAIFGRGGWNVKLATELVGRHIRVVSPGDDGEEDGSSGIDGDVNSELVEAAESVSD